MGDRLTIPLSSVTMTEEMMQSLEDRGLVIRLGPGRPPSFYVTESRDLPVERFDQRGYVLTVQG